MNITKIYYKIPFNCIDFSLIPFDIAPFDFVNCFVYKFQIKKDYPINQICGILNSFNENISDIEVLEKKDLYINELLMSHFPLRGSNKWIKINQIETVIKKAQMPKFKDRLSNLKWIIMKNGLYALGESETSTYEDVKHLEYVNLIGDNIIKVRILVEIVKRKYNLSENDYLNKKQKFIDLFKLVLDSNSPKHNLSIQAIEAYSKINITNMLRIVPLL